MIVALDTEFTCFHNPKLISIGLAAKTGEEFYAELPFSPLDCSDFVKGVVIPLLGQDPNAVCVDEYDLRTRLLTWFALVHDKEPLRIVFDFQTDWTLLYNVLEGKVPTYCERRLLQPGDNNNLLAWDFWNRNPGRKEHHALNDAKALLYSVRLR